MRVGDRVGVTNHALEEGQELEQLRVARVVEPALDRDTVVQLEAEGLRRVVDDGGLGEVAAEHGEVFEVVAVDQHLDGQRRGNRGGGTDGFGGG